MLHDKKWSCYCESRWNRVWKVLDCDPPRCAAVNFPAHTLFSHVILAEFYVHPVGWVSCATGVSPGWAALRATCEAGSAAWRSGSRRSLLALDEAWRTGVERRPRRCQVFLLERRFWVIWNPSPGGRESRHNDFCSALILQTARGIVLEWEFMVVSYLKFN